MFSVSIIISCELMFRTENIYGSYKSFARPTVYVIHKSLDIKDTPIKRISNIFFFFFNALSRIVFQLYFFFNGKHVFFVITKEQTERQKLNKRPS